MFAKKLIENLFFKTGACMFIRFCLLTQTREQMNKRMGLMY